MAKKKYRSIVVDGRTHGFRIDGNEARHVMLRVWPMPRSDCRVVQLRMPFDDPWLIFPDQPRQRQPVTPALVATVIRQLQANAWPKAGDGSPGFFFLDPSSGEIGPPPSTGPALPIRPQVGPPLRCPLGRKVCGVCAEISFDVAELCPRCGAPDWWAKNWRPQGT